jgi:hypothetical protein
MICQANHVPPLAARTVSKVEMTRHLHLNVKRSASSAGEGTKVYTAKNAHLPWRAVPGKSAKNLFS